MEGLLGDSLNTLSFLRTGPRQSTTTDPQPLFHFVMGSCHVAQANLELSLQSRTLNSLYSPASISASERIPIRPLPS